MSAPSGTAGLVDDRHHLQAGLGARLADQACHEHRVAGVRQEGAVERVPWLRRIGNRDVAAQPEPQPGRVHLVGRAGGVREPRVSAERRVTHHDQR